MSTDVLFARIPPEMKRNVDALAERQGVTLTAAVTELIRAGLDSVTSVPTRAELVLAVSQRERELAEERSKSAALEERQRAMQAVFGQVEGVTIGRCPTPGCGAPFTAVDLVARRRCASGHPLPPVLERSATVPGIDTSELLVALTAIGVLLAIVAVARK